MVFVVIQRHHKIPTFYFPAPLALILVWSIFKNNKNIQITKIQKHFHKQTLILNRVIVFFYFISLIKLNQSNSHFKSFSFNVKKTQTNFIFATLALSI